MLQNWCYLTPFKWFTQVLRVLFYAFKCFARCNASYSIYTHYVLFKTTLERKPFVFVVTQKNFFFNFNHTFTLFMVHSIIFWTYVEYISTRFFIFLSRGKKCEYLEINLCNGEKKLYWSPNVCFPWQLRVFWDLVFFALSWQKAVLDVFGLGVTEVKCLGRAALSWRQALV